MGSAVQPRDWTHRRCAPFSIAKRVALSAGLALTLGACSATSASATFIDETQPVDVNPLTGVTPNEDSVALDMSADGRYILFTTPSTALTDDDYPVGDADIWHVFRRDMQTGEIVLVDVEDGWIPETGARTGTISADGTRVVYSAGSPGQPGYRVDRKSVV